MPSLRSNVNIKAGIEEKGNIGRQDVYEVLKNAPGKAIAQKHGSVRLFLQSLPPQIRDKTDIVGKRVMDKILNDLGSYPA